MSSGVYAIWCDGNSTVYVGSAVNLSGRCKDHWRELRKGTHHNRKMQRTWDKYGEGAFRFEVLEYVPDRRQLTEREQHWITRTGAAETGMNINPTAGSMLGFRHSDWTRRKMRDAARGKTLSPEWREKIRLSMLGKNTGPSPGVAEANRQRKHPGVAAANSRRRKHHA